MSANLSSISRFRIFALTEKVLRKAAFSAFVALGAGHLTAHFAAPESPERTRIVDAMRHFAIEMPGRTGTLYDYHEGFSIMMGLLLIAYGARGFLSLRRRHLDPAEELPLLIFDVMVSAVVLGISVRLFFAVPVMLMTFALVTFLAAFFMTRREARWNDLSLVSISPLEKGPDDD